MISVEKGLHPLGRSDTIDYVNNCSDISEQDERPMGASGAEYGKCAADSVDLEAIAAARAAMAGEDVLLRTTTIFSALADPTRFRILDALVSTELCVCDLAEIAGVSQSGASHQLRFLRDRGLVASRREGNRAVYRLADEHVKDLIVIGLEHAREGSYQ